MRVGMEKHKNLPLVLLYLVLLIFMSSHAFI